MIPHVHANLPVSFRQRTVSATAPLPLIPTPNNAYASTVAAHERRREAKRNKYPWGAAAQKGSQFVIRHDNGHVLRTRGIWYQMEIRIARKEVKKPLVSSGSFAHFSSCWEKWAVGDKIRIIPPVAAANHLL